MGAYKRRYFFSFLFFSIITSSLLAQDQIINKEIFVQPGTFRLDSLLSRITQQTGVVFSYNAKKFDSRQRININSNVKNLGAFLKLIKKEKGFSIKVIENYIVIGTALKEPSQKINLPQALSPTKKPGGLKASKIAVALPQVNTIIQDSIVNVNADSVKNKSEIVYAPEKKNPINDSLVRETNIKTQKNPKDTLPSAQPISGSSQNSRRLSDSIQVKKEVKAVTRPLPKVSLTKSLFLKTGFTFDESSFMGVAIQAGMPSVYATASVNSNLLASHFRYGLATSAKLTPWLRVHFTVNNGAVSRSGSFTDSLANRFPIAVKSELLRTGLGVEFRMKSKLSIQLIANYNQLHTTYYINHVRSDLSLFGNSGDHLFYTISPPYVMNNTFSPNSDSNVKTWIGLQLNFLYRINFY